jgi:hypothetical protein
MEPLQIIICMLAGLIGYAIITVFFINYTLKKAFHSYNEKLELIKQLLINKTNNEEKEEKEVNNTSTTTIK